MPSGAKRAAPVKHAKMAEVSMNAEGTREGLTMMAMERRGPRPRPVRKAKAISIESRVPRFFPLSGVMKRPRAIPAPRREKIKPPP